MLKAHEKTVADLRDSGLLAGVRPEDAIAAVLCTLEQRLAGGEAVKLTRQLPESLQELIRDCRPAREAPAPGFGLDEFLARVGAQLGRGREETLSIVRAVFAVTQRHLSEKELLDVEGQLPRELADLWRYPNLPELEARGSVAEEELRQVVDAVRGAQVIAPDRVEEAIGVVLCTLAERLSGGEASDLDEQLPGLHGLLGPCLPPREAQASRFGREEFVRRVAEDLSLGQAEAERLVPVVFLAVQRLLPPGELRDVAVQLPRDLEELWTGAEQTAQP